MTERRIVPIRDRAHPARLSFFVVRSPRQQRVRFRCPARKMRTVPEKTITPTFIAVADDVHQNDKRETYMPVHRLCSKATGKQHQGDKPVARRRQGDDKKTTCTSPALWELRRTV
jgi:hypothetical protein